MFFGAAHKALKVISSVNSNIRTVVLDFSDVTLLDTTAMVNLESLVKELETKQVSVVLISVKPRLIDKLKRFGLIDSHSNLTIKENIQDILNVLEEKQNS